MIHASNYINIVLHNTAGGLDLELEHELQSDIKLNHLRQAIRRDHHFRRFRVGLITGSGSTGAGSGSSSYMNF